MTPLLTLLLGLAVYRATVLVVYDNVWDGTRTRIIRWSQRGPCGCDERPALWIDAEVGGTSFGRGTPGCPDRLPELGWRWPIVRTGRVLRTKVADLLVCPWCVGLWVAIIAAAVYEAWGPTEPSVVELAAAALAWAALTGVLAERVNVLVKAQQQATEAAADAWRGET